MRQCVCEIHPCIRLPIYPSTCIYPSMHEDAHLFSPTYHMLLEQDYQSVCAYVHNHSSVYFHLRMYILEYLFEHLFSICCTVIAFPFTLQYLYSILFFINLYIQPSIFYLPVHLSIYFPSTFTFSNLTYMHYCGC